MKNSSDFIGNRIRDLPVCTAVPQPTAPPPHKLFSLEYFHSMSKCLCKSYELLLAAFRHVIKTDYHGGGRYFDVFWYETPCNFVDRHPHSWRLCFNLQDKFEDEDSLLLLTQLARHYLHSSNDESKLHIHTMSPENYQI